MKILDAVVPLFGVSPRSTPALIGTAFLVAHQDHRLIVTAAHVADEQLKTPIYVPSDRGVIRQIEVPAVKTVAPNGDRDLDKIDIGFWKLPETLSAQLEQGRWFLPTPLLQPGAPFSPAHQYSFVGYPHKGTKVIYGTTRVRAVPESFTGRCVDAAVVESVGAFPGLNIAIEYDHKLVQFGKNLVTPKDRHGMSGGPVFALTAGQGLEGIPNIRVVGVGIEHHKAKKVFVATRIDALLEMISRHFAAPAIAVSAATVRTVHVDN